MEHFPISVTLLANAGVCIGYRGMTLLLDGIFGREGNPFSPLPADCRQKMCRGEPPFEKLDCLLFTHFHPDHFSPEMTMQIVGSRPVRALFFPEDEAEPVQELAYFLRRRDIPFVQLSHTTDHTVWRLGEHIRLQAFRTQHLGQEFYEVPHVCYRISFDGREVLFTADTDYLHETLAQISGTALEAAFVNPLFSRRSLINACFTARSRRSTSVCITSPSGRTTACTCARACAGGSPLRGQSTCGFSP